MPMRLGFLITARLKSSRLPLKVMKDLNGAPVIQRVIERAKEIHIISHMDIVVCTSANPQDHPLLDIANRTNVCTSSETPTTSSNASTTQPSLITSTTPSASLRTIPSTAPNTPTTSSTPSPPTTTTS